jgi:tetratricopeptide (TPR) repeat protein
MTRRTCRLLSPVALISLATVVACPTPAGAQQQGHGLADGESLGRVEFATSCAPEVQDDFNRAVAMLHSFWYQASEAAFTDVARHDPGCAMAYWGVAMSRFRQLWERPTPEDIRIGRAALESATVTGAGSEREQGFIDAVSRIYEDADGADYPGRKLAYERAMESLNERYADDPEAEIFYALSLLGTAAASPKDETYARQRKARAILEGMLARRPEHPGVAHYIIHSSDHPALADGGLQAAERYSSIAPDAPHALHMPSHIFTRLGLWDESVASNLAAVEAARRDGWTGEELHASDYLVYAYLQEGRDGEAGAILDRLPEIRARLNDSDPNYPAGVYALAAIPARYAVERRKAGEAAALEVPEGWFPGGTMCWAEATLSFARGLGAVNTGDLGGARRIIDDLEACEERLRAAAINLWANTVDVQGRTVEAWLAAAEGQREEAIVGLRAAAELEDAADKPPTTPGAVIPVRELLGELLLELERPAEALAEFETALESSPNRFHLLHGAAVAARAAGEEGKAAEYLSRFTELTRFGDRERPEILR